MLAQLTIYNQLMLGYEHFERVMYIASKAIFLFFLLEKLESILGIKHLLQFLYGQFEIVEEYRNRGQYVVSVEVE